jgi:threonine dehydrogenase-like Zn-dependent dehydrogenase
MQALQYNRPGKLILKDLPIPEPEKEEALIKVSHSGICGTDIHILEEEAPAAPVVVLGHEFSGTVAVTGKNVSHLKPGERVCVDPNNYCGHCHYCRIGEVHFCRNLEAVGVSRNGAWAEYCISPAKQVYSLPEDVSPEWGALCEPLSCILHGWDRLQPISPATVPHEQFAFQRTAGKPAKNIDRIGFFSRNAKRGSGNVPRRKTGIHCDY